MTKFNDKLLMTESSRAALTFAEALIRENSLRFIFVSGHG